MRSPRGEVRFDPTGKAPGRGAYVDRDPVCIEAAIGKGALARVLRSSLGPGELATLLNEMQREVR